jgi:hypothetical protein
MNKYPLPMSFFQLNHVSVDPRDPDPLTMMQQEKVGLSHTLIETQKPFEEDNYKWPPYFRSLHSFVFLHPRTGRGRGSPDNIG